MSSRRQHGATIEDPDVVQPQETALENVHAFGVFAIGPPGEGEEQLVKYALKEEGIAFAA